MALAHNGILRGLNSIYLQAPNIPSQDLATVRDFLTYCQCWCFSMHHHHEVEVTNFFPNVERLSGIKGLMTSNVEQHRAFTPGFELFDEYARTCPAKYYSGQKVRKLIEDFADPLAQHLRDEINTLRALDKHDSAALRKAYDNFEKELMAADNVSLLHEIDAARNPYLQHADLGHSIESVPLSLAQQTGHMKAACTTFLQCPSLCRTSSITGLGDGSEALGGSVRVRLGEIGGN